MIKVYGATKKEYEHRYIGALEQWTIYYNDKQQNFSDDQCGTRHEHMIVYVC